MPLTEKNILISLIYQPAYRVWRHHFIVVAIFAITLSQSFFAFGNNTAIDASTIYTFGIGLAVGTLTLIYCNIFLVAPYYLPKRAYASYIVVLLLMSSGLVLMKGIGEFSIFAKAGVSKPWNSITVLDGLSNLLLYAICVASTSIGILFRQLQADATEIKNLKNKQLKSSIVEFKNRIQPKFLYATLDYTSQKVKLDPKHTSETLFRLSELLRYQLYDRTRNKVLLASDIAFIRNYLLLHQQNSGGYFSFKLSVNGDSNKLIGPSTFTPCVEELVSLNPQKLLLNYGLNEEWVELQCDASGIDFHKNNVDEAIQKLRMIYGDHTIVEKESTTLRIRLKVC